MKSYKEQLREKLENFEYPYNDKAWTDFKRYRLKNIFHIILLHL